MRSCWIKAISHWSEYMEMPSFKSGRMQALILRFLLGQMRTPPMAALGRQTAKYSNGADFFRNSPGHGDLPDCWIVQRRLPQAARDIAARGGSANWRVREGLVRE